MALLRYAASAGDQGRRKALLVRPAKDFRFRGQHKWHKVLRNFLAALVAVGLLSEDFLDDDEEDADWRKIM